MKTYVSGLILKVVGIGAAGYKDKQPIEGFKPASDELGEQQVTRVVL